MSEIEVLGCKKDQPEKNLAQHIWKEIEDATHGAAGKALERGEQFAVKEIGRNIGNLAGLARFLPDGTISTGEAMKLVEEISGRHMDKATAKFLAGFDSITKEGEHITFHRKSEGDMPVDKSFGPISIDSVHVKKDISFDLKHEGGSVKLENIDGLSVKSSAFGLPMDGKINGIEIGRDREGNFAVKTDLENPTPDLARIALGGDGKLHVEAAYKDGKFQVTNKDHIEEQLIGQPVVRGVFDTGKDTVHFFEDPSLGGAGKVIGDVAYTTVVAPVETVAHALNPTNWF